jgi:A/G-specific adenine glycosylase
MAYYLRFLDAFPNVQALASAEHDRVMRLWQGLGYYSRARNMHQAARQVVEDFGGAFPANYQDLLKLKGVGSYTAAAIASIAFNQPHAVIDGNVFRFLARLFAISTPIDSTSGRKEFAELAQSLLDKGDPGTFNQAMMEFGATICKPVNPSCESCIFHESCKALAAQLIQQLPVKEGRQIIRERHMHFMIYRDRQGRILLNRRESRDIWEGLYQFPLAGSEDPLFKPDSSLAILGVSGVIRHQLTHQRILARFWHIDTEILPEIPGTIVVDPEEIENYAFPRIISRYLEKPAVPW